jgi:hypothetical protein
LIKESLSDFLGTPAYKSNQDFTIQYKTGTTWNTIFYGLIQNVQMNYLAENTKLAITITANDFTKIALNTKLTSFSITGSQASRSFTNQMTALSAAIYAVDPRVTIGHSGSGASSTTEWAYTWTDVASGEILNRFLDAELAWCWNKATDPQMLYYTRIDVNTKQAVAWSGAEDTISSIHSSSTSHYCMNDIQLVYDSDALVNKVKVTGLTADEVAFATSSSTNATSVTNYGEQSATFEVCFDNTGLSNLGAWAAAVVPTSGSGPNPRALVSVTCPAVRRDGEMTTLPLKDIGDTIQVEFSDGTTTLQEVVLISRIAHNITADHWEINLGLWKGI